MKQTHTEIKKAKLVDGIFLEVEINAQFAHNDGETKDSFRSELSEKRFREVHKDLKQAFRAFIPHLAATCEQVAITDLLPVEHIDLNQLDVTGISIGGEDDHSGIVIIGRRNLKSKRVLNLTSPFIKFYDEHNPYDYADELLACVANLKSEVEAYLYNGKAAPISQTELELTN